MIGRVDVFCFCAYSGGAEPQEWKPALYLPDPEAVVPAVGLIYFSLYLQDLPN
jgi:hypothetical protein